MLKTTEFINLFGQNNLENFQRITDSVSLLISNGFTEDESKAVVSDYLKQFPIHKLKDINILFEGLYENFTQFAKEFHEDSESEENFELFEDELKDEFIFCNNFWFMFFNPFMKKII